MKSAMRLVSRFILTSILLILVLGSLVVLSRYVIGYDPQRAGAADVVIQMLAAMRGVFTISVMISASVTIFATIRLVDRPVVPLVLVAGLWTALLILGSLVWSAPGLDQPGPIASVPEERIIRIENTRVYSPDVQPFIVSPVLVYQLDRQPPRFELFAEGIVDRDARELTIPGRVNLDLTAVEASYPAMVATPDRLDPLLRDIGGLNRLILGEPTFLLTVVLGLFLLSCWTPARLTRWPLFNAVLVFLSLRGALWLVNSIHFGELESLVTTVVRPDQLGLVSAGALAFISFLFVVILFLLPPLSAWKREVGDD